MTPAVNVSPQCVMEVFVLLAQALTDAGDDDPVDHAAHLAARVIARVEEEFKDRLLQAAQPSAN